ncbi:MAG: hypothetical protein KatS3mg110_1595 [Pirellulaceae bacterium]|nr:MAG: hypothetical protein KatS3mg110_1595 [Pirellulaceae bacterium]
MAGRWNWVLILLAAGGTFRNGLAQVVQLPVYHQFGVSTTVVVPDRGGVVLGGVDRYRAADSRFGPRLPLLPGNRSTGYEVERSVAGVHATILDLQEMDRQLLGEAAQRGRWLEATARARQPHDTRLMAASDPAPVAPGRIVQEAERRRVAQQQEAEALLERGRHFARAGRLLTARHFLNLALKRADPPMALQIQQELARLETLARDDH